MKKIHLFTGFMIISGTIAAQNVGIGTNFPASKLHVKGTADTTQLVIDANSTQNNMHPLIKLRNNSGADLMWIHSDNNSNIFLGLNAGKVNNEGGGAIYNTFIGSSAGSLNTNGSRNSTIGSGTLSSNTTGDFNSAMGFNALLVNTTGKNNSAMGSGALLLNTTGNNNSAVGFQSLLSNTTGNYNSAMGYQSLYSNTTAYYNTATGYQSLYSNTDGGQNTANGYGSLYSNSSGYYNAATGSGSLYYNISGTGNTANGSYALYSNTSGDDNTANGYSALLSNTTGYYNTANGINSLYSNTTGHHNVGMGNATLYTNVDGNYNTAIGAYADVSVSYLGDATAIGANTVVNGYDKVAIGGPYPGTIVIGGYANWSNFSDGRFKENILEDVPGLSFINNLRPVTYQINNQKLVDHITHLMPDSIASRYKKTNAEYAAMHQKRFTGFVAQEVEQTAKELGYDFDGVNRPSNETDHYSLSYASFVIPLVKAVQELSQFTTSQQKIIEEQGKKIDSLVQQLETIKNKNK